MLNKLVIAQIFNVRSQEYNVYKIKTQYTLV